MDWIPVRKVRWEEKAESRVVLYKPKFKREWLTRFTRWMGKKPDVSIKLDEYGSLVWLACDGKQSVWQICQILQDHMKESDSSLPQRTLQFFQSLLGQNCIQFKETD
jgi:hypothetical protein